jgi:hypothetical protein
MGTSGRRYAEETFDVAAVAVRFEKVLCEAVDADPNHQLVVSDTREEGRRM